VASVARPVYCYNLAIIPQESRNAFPRYLLYFTCSFGYSVDYLFFTNDLDIGEDDGYYDLYLFCLLSVPSVTLLQLGTKEFPPTPFLGAFAKFRKLTISSVLPVCSCPLVRESLPLQQRGYQ